MGKLKDISQIHIREIAALLDKPVGKRVCLPYGLTVVRRYESLEFRVASANATGGMRIAAGDGCTGGTRIAAGDSGAGEKRSAAIACGAGGKRAAWEPPPPGCLPL